MTVAQKLKTDFDNELEKAICYFSIISALNNLELGKRKIQLMAFTAIRGTITPLSARKEFVQRFNSSLASIENMKGQLTKLGLMEEREGMYRVAKVFALDFSKDLTLRIDMSIKPKENERNVS